MTIGEREGGALPSEERQTRREKPSARARDEFREARDGFREALDGLGKAHEGFGKARDGFREAHEGFGKAHEGFGKALDGLGKARDGYWDTHLHLERYGERAYSLVEEAMDGGVDTIVAVSMDLASAVRTKALAAAFPDVVLPAYGFHPEQRLPEDAELDRLFAWMEAHRLGMRAVGEVGLPYYTRTEAQAAGLPFDEAPYLRLLERFVEWAVRHDLPLSLHCVYEDAGKACDILEKRGATERAHFHWFKGDAATVERLVRGGSYVSFTPDCLYDPETSALLGAFPLDRILGETDGPWPFEGPFAGRETHPAMVRDVVRRLADARDLSVDAVADALRRNAERLYGRGATSRGGAR
ncbi:TatD family hydrolase [Paenibacillus sp. TRM 82003]|nr:TatD family hydrolase [Paenibacillus sp. TRM 82003]